MAANIHGNYMSSTESRDPEIRREATNDAAYEEVEHTADWAFQVRGRDLRQLFANAAQAMFALERPRTGESPAAAGTIERAVQVEGVDRESLLVNWLNELLYLAHKNREGYESFEIVNISDTHLRARVQGRPAADVRRYIKAVTFHNLEVKPTTGGWEATVVVDV